MNKPNDELNEVTEVKEETEVIAEITEEKPKKKKKGLKIFLWILAILLALIIALCVTVVIMIKSGEKQMTNYDDVVVEVPDIAETLDDGKIVKYNGKKYILNENVVSVGNDALLNSIITE